MAMLLKSYLILMPDRVVAVQTDLSGCGLVLLWRCLTLERHISFLISVKRQIGTFAEEFKMKSRPRSSGFFILARRNVFV